MQQTIEIGKIEIREDTRGKWILRKYRSTAGDYYSSFLDNNMEKAVIVGSMMTLECTPNPKYRCNYDITKIIAVERPKVANHTNPGVQAVGNQFHPGGKAKDSNPYPLTPSLPSILSDKDIDGMAQYANQKASIDEVEGEEIIDPEKWACYFNAKLQQQAQAFNVAMAAYIEAKKSQNIEKVQKGRAELYDR